MFWKRTTGAAAIVGLISGLVVTFIFNNLAPGLFGADTWLYTAFKNDSGAYEIPFLITMGWSFFFSVLAMVLVSLVGPKINPKSFVLDKSMFKLEPANLALVVVTLLLLSAIYIRFW